MNGCEVTSILLVVETSAMIQTAVDTQKLMKKRQGYSNANDCGHNERRGQE